MKKTRKLMRILKAYTKLYSRIEGEYYKKLNKLEEEMQKETGIKDIEFFFCDGEFAGIGNTERTMKLIHREELE